MPDVYYADNKLKYVINEPFFIFDHYLIEVHVEIFSHSRLDFLSLWHEMQCKLTSIKIIGLFFY